MARLVNSDLGSMNSSKALTSFEELSNWLSKCSSGITNFNSDSMSHLIGGGYDAVRKRLTLYVDALNKLKSICDNAFSSIKGANSDFSAYMEGEPILDDSELASAKSLLQSARDALADLYVNPKTENYNSQVSYYENQIAFLEKKVRLLEGLASKDSSLYGKIEGISSDLSTFNSAISYINSDTFSKDNINSILNIGKIDSEYVYNSKNIDSLLTAEKIGYKGNLDLSMFKENPEWGFNLWTSDKRYSLTDEEFEKFVAAMITESDKTPDDVLAVTSVALNRCELGDWPISHGGTPMYEVFGGDGYDTTEFCITQDRIDRYLPSKIGTDAVNNQVLSHGKGYTYDELAQVVYGALYDGVRNNFYTGYRAYGYEGKTTDWISPTGNVFRYENPTYDKPDAAALSLKITGKDLVNI